MTNKMNRPTARKLAAAMLAGVLGLSSISSAISPAMSSVASRGSAQPSPGRSSAWAEKQIAANKSAPALHAFEWTFLRIYGSVSGRINHERVWAPLCVAPVVQNIENIRERS